MENSIASFRRNVGGFCNHLQASCDALKKSVDRRPIPLDSASSTFIQCLNRRVESANGDLNLLDSMSFGTVSFEELLGYSYEVFNKNQSDLLELEERLKDLGYSPDFEEESLEIDDIDSDDEHLSGPLVSKMPTSISRSAVASNSAISCLEEDPFLDGSLSLKKYGLSDACLASLASEGNHTIDSPDFSTSKNKKYGKEGSKEKCEHGMETSEVTNKDDLLNPTGTQRPLVKVSKDDFESFPSYMTSLTSWEDLLTAVEKINFSLNQKVKTKGHNYFLQDEIASLDLGPKSRVYLLLLTRMNCLVVETVDGVISYRVL